MKSLRVINNASNLVFGDNNFNMNCDTMYASCGDNFEILGANDSFARVTSGNANVEVITNHLNLISEKTNSNNSVFIGAQGSGGGILLESDSGGVTLDATNGNVDINCEESINIGVYAQSGNTSIPKNVIIESSEKIEMDTESLDFVASGSINLISLTGDVSIGSSTSSSFFQIEDSNFLINQTTSTNDHQLDINLSDEASGNPGYNGIIVTSSNTSVASELKLEHLDSNGSVSLGIHPFNSNYSYYKQYIVEQSGTEVIPIYGDFVNADIGKKIYFTSTDATDTISALGTTIMAVKSNGVSVLSTSGTYTGAISRVYKIIIDSIGDTDTFKWSDNGGRTFNAINVSLSTGSISLNHGISISFDVTTGNEVGDSWIFHSKVTATVSTSRTISDAEKAYTLQPYHAFLSTSNTSDIVMSTNSYEKMRITTDGDIGIGTSEPTSTLEITNNIGKTMLVNEYNTDQQINPFVCPLETGGYVVVWESKAQDAGTDYGIYFQQYMVNGQKYGGQIKANVTTSGHQYHPHIAARRTTNSEDFIVVWASEESDGSGIYDIYAQIYKAGTALQATDIHITQGSSTNQQLYPRVCGLTNGNYCITWAGAEDSDNDVYNVYGRIIDNSGNLGSVFNVDVSSYDQTHPYPVGLTGGTMAIIYMSDFESSESITRYKIKFQRFTISNTTASTTGSVVTVGELANQTVTDGLVSAYHTADGGFLISFYRNYHPPASGYTGSIVGQTSGTTASITSHTANILEVESLSTRFTLGELIEISGYYEKIEKIEYFGTASNINKATITMSRGHKSITLYKYNSSGTAVVSNIQVNTSGLIEDEDRTDVTATNYTRDSNIYHYNRPLVDVIETHDAKFVATWTNDKISNVYYQIMNSSGVKIGDEEQVSSTYIGLKQRNPSIAPLKTMEHKEHGFVIVWDNENLDTSNGAIYQTLVNPNNHILYVHGPNENSENTHLAFTNTGKLGVGTNNPNSQIHCMSSSNNNILLESTKTNFDTSDLNSITFRGTGATDLAKITSSFSENYEVLTPNYENLLAYYKFNESVGTGTITDASSNDITGTLNNFELNTCWVDGLINGGLEFNGSNNYVNLDTNASLRNLAYGSGSGQDYSISCWVKVPTNITTSSNLDVICNNGDIGLVGNYLLTLSDTGADGNLKAVSGLTSSTGYFQAVGTTTINDDSWHYINTVYHNSNLTVQTYVDGVKETSTTGTGTINDVPYSTSNTYIGVRTSNTTPSAVNNQKGYFKGIMDEFKVFTTPLTYNDINNIYSYGNQTKGEINFSVQNGIDNLTTTAHGFTLDDKGQTKGLQIKARPYSRLTGSITSTSGSNSIAGTSTLFDDELQVGDILTFSSSTLTVQEIKSQTSLIVSENASESATSSTSIRRPAITSFYDQESNLKGILNNNGYLGLGTYTPGSKLALNGTGDANDSHYITLTNTTTENSDNGRESRITFNGSKADGTSHSLGYIEMSHDGSGDDTKSHLKIFTNNGSAELSNPLTVRNDGNIAVGINISNPLGKFHLKEESNPLKFVLESGENAESKFGEESSIYFIGTTSLGNSSDLEAAALAKIVGSSDASDTTSTGRLDFHVNKESNSLGLQPVMTMLSTGNVGCSINSPMNVFQAGPKYNLDSNYTASQSGTTVTLESGSTVDTARQYDIVNGYIVYNDSGQTTKRITSWTNATTLEVDNTETISSTNASLFYPGLNVDSTGNVGVGVTSINSKFHVEGPISTAIKTVTSSYNIRNTDSTILSNGSSLTITLTTVNTIAGRRYIIKNINASSATVDTEGLQTIDGSNTQSLSQYKFIEVQSDGTNWHIIGTNV